MNVCVRYLLDSDSDDSWLRRPCGEIRICHQILIASNPHELNDVTDVDRATGAANTV
jgi:hypothetical protein